MSDRLAGPDTFDESAPATKGESDVTAGHEDLLGCEDGNLHDSRSLHASADVTDVPAECSEHMARLDHERPRELCDHGRRYIELDPILNRGVDVCFERLEQPQGSVLAGERPHSPRFP